MMIGIRFEGTSMRLAGMTDEGVSILLAKRIRQVRLNANISQKEMASEAGISLATYNHFENGKNTSIRLKSVIAILRKLDLLDNIDLLVPEPEVSPRQIAKLQGKKRQRASGQRSPQQESSDEEDIGW